METVRQEGARVLAVALHSFAVLVCVFHAAGARADAGASGALAWKLEPDAKPAHYAVVEPLRTNLNISNVVLACEGAADRKVLQLELYLTNDGPLLPNGATPSQLKARPRAEIAIDGRVFPVKLLFADDHAVLADEQKDGFASVSERLLGALAKGRTMVLRFDLVAERPGEPPAFDGEAVVDLQAGSGGSAVLSVRSCAKPTAGPIIGALY